MALDAEEEALVEYEKSLDQGVALTMDILTNLAMAFMFFAFIAIMVIIQEILKDMFDSYGSNSIELPDILII